MPALNESFDLIRVINLPERKDRLREVTRQLSLLGMSFAPEHVEVYAATRPIERCGFDSLGAHGCFLSHLAILKDAHARGVQSVLVMEDDCEVLACNLQTIGQVAAGLEERQWDFCYLGHIETVPELAADALPGLVEYGGPVRMTHLYGVHRHVLPALVEYLEGCLRRPPGDPVGGPMDVDGALTMFRSAHPEFVTLLAQPAMAVQRSSRSDIRFNTWEMTPGVKQVMGFARVLRRGLKRY
jgi:hypothetical protein